MRKSDKEEPSLSGCYDSYVGDEDTSSDDSTSSSSKRALADCDHDVKRSRDNMSDEVVAHLFSQTSSAISFFAKAEEARSKAMQAASEQAESSTNTNLPNSNENVNNLPAQEINVKLNFFKSAAETAPLVFNPAMRFRDGSIPITYKEGNLVNLKIMKIREAFLTPKSGSLILEDGYLHNHDYDGKILIACPDNKWAIKNVATGEIRYPKAGKLYAFVTMPDKSIRISKAGPSQHCYRSGASPVVRYAGNVKFGAQGEIIEWNNDSGSYKPNASLAHQAEFGESNISKFKEYNKPVVPMDVSFATMTLAPVCNAVMR